ncbi:MAG: hypothetical protein HC927_00880 [Deltaproteobacteria bacterium]|nr:hypothetical protein [Deltaproteobacteria bacterium]
MRSDIDVEELKEEAIEPVPEAQPELLPEPEPTPELELDAEPPSTETEPDEGPRKRGKAKVPKRELAESKSDECAALRDQAKAARNKGNWKQLLQLTERRSCWARASEAKALRMQALFELDRHQECITLGGGDKSREVSKWVTICQRALD